MAKWSLPVAIGSALAGCGVAGDAGPDVCDPFSGEIELEYVAETDDDRVLVVTRPRDDWAYEDFRVFFGSADAVDERIVHSVVRLLDGGTTTIELELDGAAATAYFPVELQGDPEPWTLTVADETIALQRRDAAPDGVSYRCLVE